MKSILIVNHKEKQCGIHQYGEDLFNTLKKSKYTFYRAECSDKEDFDDALIYYLPNVIIYNYYPFTMPWLTKEITQRIKIPQLAIFHEVTQESADNCHTNMFDYMLCPDPTLKTTNPICIKTKRLIPSYQSKIKAEPNTIGSFGFGYHGKGFDSIVKQVNLEFDEATINLHIPRSDVVGKHIWSRDHPYWLERKLKKLTKPGITLNITHDFLDKKGLLDFLAGNSINCFFYDTDKYKGISSVIDSALAVHRPIALTHCKMFRHLFTEPSIFIENNTLKNIIGNGLYPLRKYYARWSEKQFILDYEKILDSVLST